MCVGGGGAPATQAEELWWDTDSCLPPHPDLGNPSPLAWTLLVPVRLYINGQEGGNRAWGQRGLITVITTYYYSHNNLLVTWR